MDFMFKQGWLQKKGQKGLQPWKKRYFMIDGQELLYFKNEGEIEPQGKINLRDVSAVETINGSMFSRGAYFNLKASNRTYELFADSQEDRQEWIDAINKVRNQNKPNSKSKKAVIDDAELAEEDINDPDILNQLDNYVEDEENIDDSDLLSQLDDVEEEAKKELEAQIETLEATIKANKIECVKLKTAGDKSGAVTLFQQVKTLEAQKKELEDKLAKLMGPSEEQTTKTSEQQKQKVIMEDDTGIVIKSRSTSQSKSAAVTKKVEVKKKEKSEEEKALEARNELLSQLENHLLTQYEQEKQKALKQRDAKNLTEAKVHMENTKKTKSDLDRLRLVAANPKIPPPKHHFETSERMVEVKNNDLAPNELEITVLRVKGLAKESASSPFFTVIFPWPSDNQQTFSTATVDPNLGAINHTSKVSIERNKKSLLSILERRKLTIELYQRKLLISTSIVAKGDMQLTALHERSEITETVEIKSGRKLICVVDIKLRLQTPLSKPHMEKVVEKFLVFDEWYKEGDGKELPSATSTVSQPAPLTTTTTTTTAKASTPQTTPAPAKTREPPTPTQAKEEAEEEEFDPNSVDNLISNDVLEWELKNVTDKIAQYKAKRQQTPEDLTDRQQQIQMKLNMLQIQASTGQLDQDQYLNSLSDKVQLEKSLAAKFLKQGNREQAALCVKRYKLMEAEIQASLE